MIHVCDSSFENSIERTLRPRKTVLSRLTSEVLYKTNSEWSLFVQWNNILHSVKDETLHSTRLRLVEYSVSYLSPRAKSCTIALMTILYTIPIYA